MLRHGTDAGGLAGVAVAPTVAAAARMVVAAGVDVPAATAVQASAPTSVASRLRAARRPRHGRGWGRSEEEAGRDAPAGWFAGMDARLVSSLVLMLVPIALDVSACRSAAFLLSTRSVMAEWMRGAG